MSYDNSNTFALFEQEKTKESQPAMTGKVTLADGTEMRLAAWWQTPKSGGNQFLSGKLSEFQESQGGQQQSGGGDLEETPF